MLTVQTVGVYVPIFQSDQQKHQVFDHNLGPTAKQQVSDIKSTKR